MWSINHWIWIPDCIFSNCCPLTSEHIWIKEISFLFRIHELTWCVVMNWKRKKGVMSFDVLIKLQVISFKLWVKSRVISFEVLTELQIISFKVWIKSRVISFKVWNEACVRVKMRSRTDARNKSEPHWSSDWSP